MSRFYFEFESRYRYLLLPLGVIKTKAYVTIDDGRFRAQFGPWKVDTAVTNISGYERSGDYKWYRAIGIRGSLTDNGLTFGSTTRHGVCLKFIEPVPALLPGFKPHPGLTVTVADPDGLAAALEAAGVAAT